MKALMDEKHPAGATGGKKKSYNYDPPLKINSAFPDHCGVRGGDKGGRKIKKRHPEMCENDRNSTSPSDSLDRKNRNKETFEEKNEISTPPCPQMKTLMDENIPWLHPKLSRSKKKSYNYDPPLKINSTFPHYCGVRGG
ncbi:hypothetical protein CEXT_316121 [Caerostris extrusa]|uniref:Prolactin receptor n=1 Tax=Caerostris extrusa TaxID=172846 RepID=A0AAV4MKK5_CAEEX|nr:hypothetical protein CEXT_316121 [Caerostris extrusa]